MQARESTLSRIQGRTAINMFLRPWGTGFPMGVLSLFQVAG
jgi:hypothetical protein